MGEALLRLEGVSKSYWRGVHEVKVLSDLTLEVRAGQFVVVWGKRGAGKTTLLRIAAGLETPDRGRVRFEGGDLAGLSETRHAALMRERIGWMRRAGPQVELPMLDYVALPLMATHRHSEAYTRARGAMARVNVGECAGQTWASLSDGERALVAIARGIVRQPSLLLGDDPTTNLGLREREQVIELLRELAEERNLAVLMTVPDMPEMMGAHQIEALSGGRLLAPPEAPGPPAADNVIAFRGRERSA
jgi:ABC-type lipoprotein export system ATPase subunit